MNFTKITTDEKVLILDGAQVYGDVCFGEECSVWYNAVIRGELKPVRIGKRCNVQDNAVIHNETVLGDDVSVGHGAIVHGCTVGDRVMIGMGAILLDGAKIGNDCLIAAGAVVTGKTDAPDGSMLVGSPAKVVKELSEAQKAYIVKNGEEYLKKMRDYREHWLEK